MIRKGTKREKSHNTLALALVVVTQNIVPNLMVYIFTRALSLSLSYNLNKPLCLSFPLACDNLSLIVLARFSRLDD